MKSKRKNTLAFLVISLVVGVIIYFLINGNYQKKKSGVPTNQVDSNKTISKSEADSIQKLNRPKNQNESLTFIGKKLRGLIENKITLNELMKELEGIGLEPTKISDTNEYTGSMTIIRTKNTLPGTRYFHGQFFSNENGGAELQHLSFDFNGGVSQLDSLGSKLKESLGLTGPAEISRGGYRMYRIGDSHVMWAKVIDEKDYKDLKSDPYKAYTKDDIGRVIRIAVEQEIH